MNNRSIHSKSSFEPKRAHAPSSSDRGLVPLIFVLLAAFLGVTTAVFGAFWTI